MNNFNKIVRKIPVMDVNLEGDLYVRFNVNLNLIFSKFEKSELLLYKMLSEDCKKDYFISKSSFSTTSPSTSPVVLDSPKVTVAT